MEIFTPNSSQFVLSGEEWHMKNMPSKGSKGWSFRQFISGKLPTYRPIQSLRKKKNQTKNKATSQV